MAYRLILSILFVLGGCRPILAQTDEYGLCSQVFLMHQYCTRGQQSSTSGTTNQGPPRVGKAGPRGSPGPPGRPAANVDQAAINAAIDERLQGFDELRTKVSQLEELLTWHKESNGLFYKVFQTQVSYASAKAKCVEKGGTLASVGLRDPEVRRQLLTLMKPYNVDVWIGANDIQQEGVWVWEDGTVSDGTPLIDWYPGGSQPSNSGGNEHCAHYRPTYNWQVNDDPCQRTKMYLCEKKV